MAKYTVAELICGAYCFSDKKFVIIDNEIILFAWCSVA